MFPPCLEGTLFRSAAEVAEYMPYQTGSSCSCQKDHLHAATVSKNPQSGYQIITEMQFKFSNKALKIAKGRFHACWAVCNGAFLKSLFFWVSFSIFCPKSFTSLLLNTSCGFHNKSPQTWWLTTKEIYSLMVLESRRLKSKRGRVGWLLVEVGEDLPGCLQ